MYLSLKVNFYANSTPLFTPTIVVSSLRKKNPCLRQEKPFFNDNVNDNDNNNFSAEVFRFPQNRMRLSIAQKRFWLCIRLSLFFCEAGFFHDEIEIPERVTILVIRLSGCSHTSRIIANSVKNSTEFLSLKWVFLVFVLIQTRTQKKEDAYKRHPLLFLYRGVWKITLRLSPSVP